MKDIKIRSISLKSFKGFDDITIDCAKSDTELYQWTVLLGNNNTGKTRILQAIADMRPVKLDFKSGFERFKNVLFPVYWSKNKIDGITDMICNLTNFSGVWSLKRVVNGIHADSDNFHIFGYGVGRYPLLNVNLSGQESDNCETLFSHDKQLINLEEWLIKCDYQSKSNNPKAKKQLEKLREIICSNLFPEIEDFRFESTDKMESYVLFKTKDGWFKYTELGFGYQSMLSWVVDLSKRMFDTFPESQNPLHESAVVLVDEIDLHLHPKWQREVIAYVSEIFKNVQFIVTTHSPLVIQSMQEVNLYVLRREDEKIAVEHSPVTNFSGWTVEEILRDTMKLDNDIHSDYLQNTYEMFDEGLDNNDINKAREAYNTLIKILHPNNPARRLLKLQLSQMEIDDKD
ncbi:MAG: AAA family ATPase [Bacteroidales bacterium]|nr:AAA family ATPase [Bacteroidales bacterium]